MNNYAWWTIEQKSHQEILHILNAETANRPWASYFLYDFPLSPSNPNSVCRIGFVPYNQCIQDRYFYIDQSRNPEILAAGGITTQIHWDFNPEHLPNGWQGSIWQSHRDYNTKTTPNTLVALLAFTVPRFRGKGMSGKILTKMCLTAQERGYRYLIVPALPPTQFQKEHVRCSMDKIVNLKRDDGSYYDYWIRLHTRKGATIIGTCPYSHRFIFNLDDFYRHVSSDSINTTGEHIVRLDKDQTLGPDKNNMWQLVYADIDRDFITFNWGCVWVQYDIHQLDLTTTD